MEFSLNELRRKLKYAFPRHVIYLDGYPTAHGGVNILYDLPGDGVVTYGLNDYGDLVFEWLPADEYCEKYKDIVEYTTDLVRSVNTRSPEPMERWSIPAEAWWRAWCEGEMYELYWDYVVAREKQSRPHPDRRHK